MPVKYWEIIADDLSKAGWSLGWVSALDVEGRTIWIVDAHGYGNDPLCNGKNIRFARPAAETNETWPPSQTLFRTVKRNPSTRSRVKKPISVQTNSCSALQLCLMNTRILFYVCLAMAFAISQTFSAPPPDAQARKMLVGVWKRTEKINGLDTATGFVFRDDGTCSLIVACQAEKNMTAAVEIEGKWRVKGGILITEVTNSDCPDFVRVGTISRLRLLAVTKREYRMIRGNGDEVSYFRFTRK